MTRCADERALVDVQVELEAHLQQQPTLDDPGRHRRRADRAEEDGVERAQLVERGVGEDLAVAEVAVAAEVEVDRVDGDARRLDDLDRLGGDLGPDAVTPDDGDAMRCSLTWAVTLRANESRGRARARR